MQATHLPETWLLREEDHVYVPAHVFTESASELPSATAGIVQCWCGAVSIDPPAVQPSLTKAVGQGDLLAQPQPSTQEPKRPQKSCFRRPAF